jgi:hypothetical protein
MARGLGARLGLASGAGEGRDIFGLLGLGVWSGLGFLSVVGIGVVVGWVGIGIVVDGSLDCPAAGMM